MVHTAARRGRSRTRILYWFRTPAGIRVGRSPLDENTTRLLETHNPGIRFDWPRILEGKDDAAAADGSPPQPVHQDVRPHLERPTGETTGSPVARRRRGQGNRTGQADVAEFTGQPAPERQRGESRPAPGAAGDQGSPGTH